MAAASTTTLIELHVPSFARAKTFYTRLGFTVIWENAPRKREGYLVMKRGKNIICFWCGNKEIYYHHYFKNFSQKTPTGYGVEISIFVNDIETLYKSVVKSTPKKQQIQPLIKRSWGKKDFRILDPFGFYLRFTEPYNILKKQ